MDLFIRFLYSIVSASLNLLILIKLIPKLKKENRNKHIILVGIISLYMTFYDITNIWHTLLFYTVIILYLKTVYNSSSFVASISVVFMYIITLLASMISSNICVMLFGVRIDYRGIFASHHLNANIVYIVSIFVLLRYYQFIVRLFKKIAGTTFKFDMVMILSNIALFTSLFAYQRLTFENMVEFSVKGILNQSGSQAYAGYFLLTFSFITVMALVLIILLNRIFIVDKSLERYKIKADTDVMTGVLSREAGLTHLKTEMSRAVAYKTDLTIAYVDVNDLKLVNDRWGHKEGDKLIKSISDIIQSTLREFDIVARLGGDEFLIVFTRCNKAQAQRVWRRITDEFLRVNMEGGFSFKISASVGITQFNSVKHTSLMSFVHEADGEMYIQKKSIKASRL